MADLSRMEGTPWHLEKITRGEGDDRRHRSRCRYYNKVDKYCPQAMTRCFGSAHCVYYEEKTDDNEEEFFDYLAGYSKNEKTRNAGNDKDAVLDENCRKCKIGTMVSHSKYGKGSVIEKDGNKVTIRFDSGTTSKFRLDLCIKNGIIQFL